jgi:hypothetical protein
MQACSVKKTSRIKRETAQCRIQHDTFAKSCISDHEPHSKMLRIIGRNVAVEGHVKAWRKSTHKGRSSSSGIQLLGAYFCTCIYVIAFMLSEGSSSLSTSSSSFSSSSISIDLPLIHPLTAFVRSILDLLFLERNILLSQPNLILTLSIIFHLSVRSPSPIYGRPKLCKGTQLIVQVTSASSPLPPSRVWLSPAGMVWP